MVSMTLGLDTIDSEWWGVSFEVVLFLYCFVGLAIICDNYLVPSLEVLCVRWRVREDVAGASFMAFGSSAPEIIVNAISTFKASGASPQSINLGLGAITGSSVIAFSLIPACCAIFCSRDVVALDLKRRPLLRDILTYLVALCLLVSSYRDGLIELHESASLLVLYAVYGLVVFFSPAVRHHYHHTYLQRPLVAQESFVVRQESLTSGYGAISCTRREADREAGADEDLQGETNGTVPCHEDVSGEGQEEDYRPRPSHESLDGFLRGAESDDEGDIDAGSPSAVERAFAVFAKPLKLLCKLGCPACELDTDTEWRYPFTFALSFAWVAFFSFIISTIVDRWGDLTNLPLSFFGFYLVSLGAEVPDTVQSVTVARRGYGSMAVSNAIGSQICNICFGLGLPWTLSLLSGHTLPVTDSSHLLLASYLQFVNIFVLFSLLFVPVVVYRQQKAQLTKKKGIAMLLMYVLILIIYGLQHL